MITSDCSSSNIDATSDATSAFSDMGPKRGFKIASLNITSLVKHIDELAILMSDKPLDVLAINETRLDDNITDEAISVPGYCIVRNDRNRQGGGVAIYIKEAISFKVRSDLKCDEIESLTVEITKPNQKPFLVTSWYRPPSSEIEVLNCFDRLLSRLEDENKESIILGDVNCNLLAKNVDSRTSTLKFTYDVYQYSQLIKTPTRITENTSTLIDHLITNMPHKIIKSGVCHLSISDHSLIYAIRRSIPLREKPRIIETRNYKDFDLTCFLADLKQLPWDLVELSDDPNEMLCVWKTLFLDTLNTHAPVKTKRVRNVAAPWITPQLKKLMFYRDNLKKKAIISKTNDSWELYQKIRNSVNSQIRKTKRSYFLTNIEVNKNNPKKTWKTLNSLLGKKSKNTIVRNIKVEGHDITEPKKIAELFNNYFVNVGPSLANEIPATSSKPEANITHTSSTFQFQPISGSAVREVINKLKAGKATGMDKIPAEVIKAAAPVIAQSLAVIFNASLKTGVFPDEWKTAKVSPVFKNGAKNDRNNYRPISVLPVVSKVFEKIVFSQAYNYFMENNLLSEHQSGFRPLHSTESACSSQISHDVV